MHKLTVILCNLIWLISAIPGYLLFRISLSFPKKAQKRVLRRILKSNRNTAALNGREFRSMKPQSYEDILPAIDAIMRGERNILTHEYPFLLEPTGGSTAGTKLIPYTKSLRAEFRRALSPWIASLFLRWPGLLAGQHYWCITPTTNEKRESVIPIGFDSDHSYFGSIQALISGTLFPVPDKVRKCPDHASAEFITLLYLLKAPNLRLISVWHPSLLTIMLATLESRFDELLEALESGVTPDDIHAPFKIKPSPRRAAQLRKMGCKPACIWKHMTLISCWAGPNHQSWVSQIQSIFPRAYIQPKGLIATEGITAIPLGTTSDVTTVRSHFYEFEATETKSIIPLWKIEKGKQYHLILTTGGGLYRYATNDIVQVCGFIRQTPRLKFLTRNNITSDIVGEKISLAQAQNICQRIPTAFKFAMIAPEPIGDIFRYTLYLDSDTQTNVAEYLENELCRNYHYRHARNLGQLEHSTICYVRNAENKIYSYLQTKGQRAGSIKLQALSRETHWRTILTKT